MVSLGLNECREMFEANIRHRETAELLKVFVERQEDLLPLYDQHVLNILLYKGIFEVKLGVIPTSVVGQRGSWSLKGCLQITSKTGEYEAAKNRTAQSPSWPKKRSMSGGFGCRRGGDFVCFKTSPCFELMKVVWMSTGWEGGDGWLVKEL